jgi:hypothetical protein
MSALRPLTGAYPATRDALHRVAEEVVAPARKPHNEIALRQTPGGFGTPEFEFEDRRVVVRVEGTDLVVETEGTITSAPIESIASAAHLVGEKLLPNGLPGDDSPLAIDPQAAAALAAFYEFAAGVLGELRGDLPVEADASDVVLWPEHFDIAFEGGSEEDGRRANYGASPGDEAHPEPYLYVGPWAKVEGEEWNATGFSGAELGYAELLAATDPRATALEFFRRHEAAL